MNNLQNHQKLDIEIKNENEDEMESKYGAGNSKKITPEKNEGLVTFTCNLGTQLYDIIQFNKCAPKFGTAGIIAEVELKQLDARDGFTPISVNE
jgi:hypothetical protein